MAVASALAASASMNCQRTPLRYQGAPVKVSSSARLPGCLTVARLASVLLFAAGAASCGHAREQEEERARRGRKMRDVSRMLDAMESADPAVVAAVTSLPSG